jgi:hypothetical protein
MCRGFALSWSIIVTHMRGRLMNLPASSLGLRRQRYLDIITDPRRWPTWPFLPLIRPLPGGEENQLGVLYDARGVSGLYGFSATVFLANLFLLPSTEEKLLALPKCVYDRPEEIVDDGWRVD